MVFPVLFHLQLLTSGNFNSKQDACVETDDTFNGTNGANASCICNLSVNIEFSHLLSLYVLSFEEHVQSIQREIGRDSTSKVENMRFVFNALVVYSSLLKIATHCPGFTLIDINWILHERKILHSTISMFVSVQQQRLRLGQDIISTRIDMQ